MVTTIEFPVKLTPRAMRILERSRDEATAAGGNNFIGVEHIFLAILHEGRSVPAQVVSELGYTTSILERLSEFLRSEGFGDAVPRSRPRPGSGDISEPSCKRAARPSVS
jgi:ATP-dependent Clp protease ATP-binding subunit ClpA